LIIEHENINRLYENIENQYNTLMNRETMVTANKEEILEGNIISDFVNRQIYDSVKQVKSEKLL
jgi:hypothetical protein